MGATPTTTPTTTNDTRKVWVFERKQVISYDFQVVAKSKAEALRILEEEPYNFCDDVDDFNHEKYGYAVHRIDGSWHWHKDMSPKLIDKYEQELITKESRYINDQPYKIWKKVKTFLTFTMKA